MAGQTVIVSVLADTKSFDNGLRSASSSLARFSTSLSRFSGAVTLGVTVAATAFTKFVGTSVASAGELEQALGGAEVVFGDFYKFIETESATAFQKAGLAQNDYLQSANLLGVFLSGAGIAAKDLATETDTLIQRGADVAALFGGTAVEALDAFASALKGEYNPIEKYGVVLNEAIVQQKAFAMTGKTVASTLTIEEKQAARLALIYEKTAKAQGRFLAESGTYAGSLAIFNARLQNFLNDVGTKLLPTLSGVFPQLTKEIDKFVASADFEQFTADLASAITELAKGLPDIIRGFTGAFGYLVKNKKQIAEVLAAIIALPPALNAISASLDFFRIASIALAGGWTVLTSVFGGLKASKFVIDDLAKSVASLEKQGRPAEKGIAKLGLAFFSLKEFFTSYIEGPGKETSKLNISIAKGFQNVTSALAATTAYIQVGTESWKNFGLMMASIGSKILPLLRLFGRFFLIGYAIEFVVGVFRGIYEELSKSGEAVAFATAAFSVFSSVINGLGGAFKLVLDLSTGIGEFVQELGRWVGKFLINPLKTVVELWQEFLRLLGQYSRTRGNLTAPTTGSNYYGVTPPTYTPYSAPRASSMAPTVYNVNVNALTPSPEVGRVVVKAISDFERTGGAR